HPQTAVMLQTQYRMHEDIMRFSARYFYENKLVADASVATALLEPGMLPFDFIDTAGCGFTEAQDPETLSRYNEEEAQFLIRQVEKLILHVGVENWNFSIGIITPYSAQVERLIKLAEQSEELSTLAAFITIN